MGCTTSKQPVCRNCHTPCSPITRSYSMHVHHPPQREGDTYHVVALKSTTLGYLDSSKSSKARNQPERKERKEPEGVRENDAEMKSKEFAVGVIEAKTWSKMIEEKIPKVVPKTPIRTPPGEPEMINAWELMEGLDDTSPLRPPANHHHYRSFSFHVAPTSIPVIDEPKPKLKEEEQPLQKPLWLQLAESNDSSDSNSISIDTSIASDFDPEVISAFRKSLEGLPPANPFRLKPLVNEKQGQDGDSFEVINEKISMQQQEQEEDGFVSKCKNPTRVKDKLVLYFTSLRGVRKTYEDCCHVRVILKGLGVRVDERDVSMHSGFKDELRELLKDGLKGGLPRVFVGEKYIGGADEIWQMHEDGQLEKVLEGCEMEETSGDGVGCEACGDIRFLPCETCSGSCKIYYEGSSDGVGDEDHRDEDEDEDEDEDGNGFQRCPDCNENGLVRCPICCD